MNLSQALRYTLGETLSEPAVEAHPANAVRLSRREQETAILVAQSLSNQEFAAKLVVSVRTAESHILSILNKLGFNSRSQIASWASEQRLLTTVKELNTAPASARQIRY